MSQGQIVADGPTTEIKSIVGVRTIRATLAGPTESDLEVLDGVRSVQLRGEVIVLTCIDSDAAIRALLGRYPAAKDIEITGAGLEEAFLQLTGNHDLAMEAPR
jgi:ABC-2 type transport system ATP-binding protein